MDIDVNYHSSIRIGNIYVDPFGVVSERKDAKYIFITHSHYDHYSFEDIKKVKNDNTIFVCTKDVYDDLKEKCSNRIVVVESNKEYEVNDVRFMTFPSYNLNKKFHPLNNGWVGYVIEINNVKYAIIGDSDLTDEIKQIKCDVLFVPIGGTYTMVGKEAGELANIIKPKLVVPTHYNGIVGNKDNEKEFLSNLNKEIEYKIFL